MHPWQFAVASRNAELASYYAALAHQSLDWTDFALGNYSKLKYADDPAVRLSAQLALGLTDGPDIERKLAEPSFDAGTLRLALALVANDAARAQRELTALLVTADRASPMELESLGDVVLAGELVGGIAPLAAVFAKRGAETPSRRDRRFATLGAALTGSPIQDGGTDRDQRRATAIRAELAGDHASAIGLLTEIVEDHSAHWDYAERAALLRNLRAVNDRGRITALCEDTLRPAVPRFAMLLLRRACHRPG